MHTQTSQTLAGITPADALEILRAGNERFCSNLRANRDLLRQVNETRAGQFPFAAILSCMDSRTSTELIFDQGLGDIFSIRIAGNCVNDDILGSMEFACRVVGSKLILVLGHSRCGAISGACSGVELGHLTGLLAKLRPAVDRTPDPTGADDRSPSNPEFVQQVALSNVRLAMEEIRSRSEILRTLEAAGSIAIQGAIYDVETGAVEFLE